MTKNLQRFKKIGGIRLPIGKDWKIKIPKEVADDFKKEGLEKLKEAVEKVREETGLKSPKIKREIKGDELEIVLSWGANIGDEVFGLLFKEVENVLKTYSMSLVNVKWELIKAD